VDGWHEGSDGSRPAYSERLWPGPVLLIMSVVVIAPVAIAYGAVFGAALGWTLGILIIGLAWAWLLGSAPLIRVDERVLRAGRARLPREFIANPIALDGRGISHERAHGDVRTFMVLRPGTTRHAVLLDVTDPADPHPRWIVQTRRPQALIEALATPPMDTHGSPHHDPA